MNDAPNELALAGDGALLGLKTGAITALLYTGCYVLVTLSDFGPSDVDATVGLLIMFMLFVGCVIGVLPALLLGAITGWLNGLLLSRLRMWLTAVRAGLLGVLLCIAIALPINAIFWPVVFGQPRSDGADAQYWSLVGVPSLIYIAVGAGMSMWLYTTYLADRQMDSVT